jgi:uncharacterized membrane protein
MTRRRRITVLRRLDEATQRRKELMTRKQPTTDLGVRDALEVLGGIGLGATLMYFADPDRGPERRQRVSDGVSRGGQRVGSAVRDRTRAAGAQGRHLAETVRERVTERVSARRERRGVDRMSSGSGAHASSLLRQPGVLAAVAGGALAIAAARQRGAVGSLMRMAGLTLLASSGSRSVLNANGRSHGTHVVRSISIDAPVEEVFEYFSALERWPEWMPHLREVVSLGPERGEGERTHWIVEGPANVPVEWEAETTRYEPERIIGWTSVEDSEVDHAGSVRFAETPSGGTRVSVHLTYHPPAGVVGIAAAKLFGRDAAQQLAENLLQLKRTVEQGALDDEDEEDYEDDDRGELQATLDADDLPRQ